jgi:2,5-diamino-6-(ribosylamino)-4(3H)-pyrimidinone 5'-phosphate reductase
VDGRQPAALGLGEVRSLQSLTGEILRLYPLPPKEIAGGIYEDLELPPPERRDPSRPYVAINMVSSVDGRSTIEGKASRIGSRTDRQTMRTLRSRADAVMIGAGTLRAERLSLGLDDPVGRQPLAVIVTTSGNVPLENNLIVGERQEVLVIAPQDVTVRFSERRVLRVSKDRSDNIDLAKTLKVLKAEYTVDLLLVEGGPRLSYSLISHSLADELFLTLAPKLIGGTLDESPAILNGPALVATDINLLSTHLAGDELFLRYGLHPLHPDD